MDGQFIRLLLVHGAIVLFIGILAGIPFWITIITRRDQATIRSWRVAHSTLIADGLLLLVAGLLAPQLTLTGLLPTFLVWALITSAYGFVFALIFGACKGYRGLQPKPLGSNTIFFLGHVIGATGVVLGMSIVIYGLLRL